MPTGFLLILSSLCFKPWKFEGKLRDTGWHFLFQYIILLETFSFFLSFSFSKFKDFLTFFVVNFRVRLSSGGQCDSRALIFVAKADTWPVTHDGHDNDADNCWGLKQKESMTQSWISKLMPLTLCDSVWNLQFQFIQPRYFIIFTSYMYLTIRTFSKGYILVISWLVLVHQLLMIDNQQYRHSIPLHLGCFWAFI